MQAIRSRSLGAVATGVTALVICGVLGWQTLASLDVALVWDRLGGIGGGQWALALLATAASFAAIGRYDAIWHRLLQTGVAEAKAARVGMAAIAVGQALGLTALTSAAARWRGLPQLSALTVASISAAVGLSFMLCWAVLAVTAAVATGLIALSGGSGLAMAGVVLLAIAASAVLWRRLALATRRASGALLVWTTVDLVCAATALWLLLPADSPVTWAQVVAAYILALGVGLISNTPGGLGPLELMLLALLPAVAGEDVLSALLAFRVVYYLIPFACGAIYLARPARAAQRPAITPAAWGLARQSGAVAPLGDGWAHVIRPCGLATVLGDPTGPVTLPQRHTLYKVGARWAQQARAAGWTVARLSDTAVIDLADWTLDIPARKRLRAALRRSAAQDVTVTLADGPLPLAAMQAIARDWARHRGGELGLTVGRYCPSHVARQAVVLIHVAGRLDGFVTCDTGRRDWALDLIRYRPTLPEGAVHAAIVAAIAAARTSGAQHVDLGAVPAPGGVLDRWSPAKDGLRRFKQTFAPRWSPRYIAAPTPLRLGLTGLALAWGIQRPLGRRMSALQHRLAAFEIETRRVIGDIRATRQKEPTHARDTEPDGLHHGDAGPRLAAG